VGEEDNQWIFLSDRKHEDSNLKLRMLLEKSELLNLIEPTGLILKLSKLIPEASELILEASGLQPTT